MFAINLCSGLKLSRSSPFIFIHLQINANVRKLMISNVMRGFHSTIFFSKALWQHFLWLETWLSKQYFKYFCRMPYPIFLLKHSLPRVAVRYNKYSTTTIRPIDIRAFINCKCTPSYFLQQDTEQQQARQTNFQIVS